MMVKALILIGTLVLGGCASKGGWQKSEVYSSEPHLGFRKLKFCGAAFDVEFVRYGETLSLYLVAKKGPFSCGHIIIEDLCPTSYRLDGGEKILIEDPSLIAEPLLAGSCVCVEVGPLKETLSPYRFNFAYLKSSLRVHLPKLKLDFEK